MCDPTTPVQYFQYLRGFWKDSLPLTSGGTGHDTTGLTTKFIFPGKTDLCDYGTDGYPPPAPTNPVLGWCEKGEANPPSDRRGLGSMGPFTFEPGEVVNIDVAFIWARAISGDEYSSVQNVQLIADNIKKWYKNNNFPSCEHFEDIDHISQLENSIIIYPNPATSELVIEYSGKKSAYSITDISGRIICSGNIHEEQTRIQIKDLSPGFYIVCITDGGNKVCKKLVKE
ncbi:MAG: T9SS type A sorting domain-containing protein [Bacteroidia bacterium]|nr:T9SS type A sorting domain-containing protein [Bacteroidia bacterium]